VTDSKKKKERRSALLGNGEMDRRLIRLMREQGALNIDNYNRTLEEGKKKRKEKKTFIDLWTGATEETALRLWQSFPVLPRSCIKNCREA